jgi:hypothetical protein
MFEFEEVHQRQSELHQCIVYSSSIKSRPQMIAQQQTTQTNITNDIISAKVKLGSKNGQGIFVVRVLRQESLETK